MTDDPKTILHTVLRSQRDSLRLKLEGLSERDARLPRTEGCGGVACARPPTGPGPAGAQWFSVRATSSSRGSCLPVATRDLR